MKPRMSHLMANLTDKDLLREVSVGLDLVAKNVTNIESCADALQGASAGRGRSILRAVGAEEAAKYLILLDAVRCPRNRPAERAAQLKRFNRHLAKGIYAEVAEIRPADYAEVLRYIEMLRQAYYLDGPNDVDWIFRNSIEADREQALYVDYVSTDEGVAWFDPTHLDDISRRPLVIELVLAMHRTGFGSVDGVTIVADEWREFAFEPSTGVAPLMERTKRTLDRMIQLEDGHVSSGRDLHLIWDIWTFPLWNTDLEKEQVDLEELRSRQSQWSPD